jgi:hypothetical protein
MGEPGAAPERKAKRTMIGVDIDLPAELFPPFGKDLSEEETTEEVAVREVPKSGKTSGCVIPKSGQPSKDAEVEEDWIK